MEIDENAPVRVRREAILRAAPPAVWRLQSGIARWSRWLPNVAFTTLPEAPSTGTVFQWKVNGMHTVSRIEVMEPERRIGWSSRSFGTHGAHLWTLTEVPAAAVRASRMDWIGEEPPVVAGDLWTRVESVEVIGGWIARILRRTIRKTLERSGDLWMSALVECAEREFDEEFD